MPDKRASWINQDENDWDDLTPVADKKTKAAKTRSQERAIFKLFSLGVSTNRDAWSNDSRPAALLPKKAGFFSHRFNEAISRSRCLPTLESQDVRNLRPRRFKSRSVLDFFTDGQLVRAFYRPSLQRLWLFQCETFIDRPGALSPDVRRGSRDYAPDLFQ